MVDLVITCDEIIERTKTVPKKFIEKESACKILKFYILLAFFSYLCIIDSIYCYLVKYQVKKACYHSRHKKELKEVIYLWLYFKNE